MFTSNNFRSLLLYYLIQLPLLFGGSMSDVDNNFVTEDGIDFFEGYICCLSSH